MAQHGHGEEDGKSAPLIWQEFLAKGPRGRLADFSYAGYHTGEAAVPEVPVKADVRGFGARGDGKTDDSAAVQAALAETARRGGGAVLFPAGTYRITALLQGPYEGVVLRGEGPADAEEEGTVLLFEKPLSELLGPNRRWSWSGGLIWPKPDDTATKPITTVTEDARRGEFELMVHDARGIQPGQFVQLRLHNTDEELSLLRQT